MHDRTHTILGRRARPASSGGQNSALDRLEQSGLLETTILGNKGGVAGRGWLNVTESGFLWFGFDVMIVLAVLVFYGCFGVHVQALLNTLCNHQM